MTDLSNLSLHGKIVAFADDVQLLYKAKRTEENMVELRIRSDIEQIEMFLEQRFMQLNSSKTVITRFGSAQILNKVDADRCFSVGDSQIKIGIEVRNLCLYLDSSLTFRPYFDKIAHQCSMTATKKDMSVLQRIINHSIRVIYEKRKFDHIGEVKNAHKWHDINRLAEIEFNKIMSKVLNKKTSDFLNSLLTRTSHGRTRVSFLNATDRKIYMEIKHSDIAHHHC